MAQYNNANLVFKHGNDIAYVRGLSASDVEKLTADHTKLGTIEGKVTTLEDTTIPALDTRVTDLEEAVEEIEANDTKLSIAAAAPEKPEELGDREGVLFPAGNLLNWS